jgi:hypothetical protein
MVNFMIWLRVCQPKMTLFRTLSSIVTYLLMNSSIATRFHPFCLLPTPMQPPLVYAAQRGFSGSNGSGFMAHRAEPD